jgi:hypothetical protein
MPIRAWVRGIPPALLLGTRLAFGQLDFQKDVRPILEEACTSCHGAEVQESGLRLDSETAILKGGLSGRVVVPGKSAESLLMRRVLGLDEPRMPFGSEPLSPSQIAILRDWIDRGDFPAFDAAAPRATHWAYLKP